MNEIVTIRQRGQITIPKKIRKLVSWLSEESVVGVKVNDNQICISPYQKTDYIYDWKDIWEKIKLSRSFLGKRGNLSRFIIEDRQKH